MSQVYFDVKIGSGAPERIIFTLYDDVAPRTTANFRQLATTGISDEQYEKLQKPRGFLGLKGYKGSSFHRIIPNFMLQGGDFTVGNGTGGVSIYGAKFTKTSTSNTQNLDSCRWLVS
ncbi:hypothetical protein M408DRAFT_87956 [Serendipita vermifera MAFF 305830]|uniref:Peptidyl-prolyl cis-trans isomerase n=1 Tax=Serendipita vermifera MAFF 305830 TaxID=933852 RepID=A0A0C2X776_SERVB|nr:hypothetical protein M408DRAFT_87956 [Serendipita vermifera MAFF 305830]